MGADTRIFQLCNIFAKTSQKASILPTETWTIQVKQCFYPSTLVFYCFNIGSVVDSTARGVWVGRTCGTPRPKSEQRCSLFVRSLWCPRGENRETPTKPVRAPPRSLLFPGPGGTPPKEEERMHSLISSCTAPTGRRSGGRQPTGPGATTKTVFGCQRLIRPGTKHSASEASELGVWKLRSLPVPAGSSSPGLTKTRGSHLSSFWAVSQKHRLCRVQTSNHTRSEGPLYGYGSKKTGFRLCILLKPVALRPYLTKWAPILNYISRDG